MYYILFYLHGADNQLVWQGRNKESKHKESTVKKKDVCVCVRGRKETNMTKKKINKREKKGWESNRGWKRGKREKEGEQNKGNRKRKVRDKRRVTMFEKNFCSKKQERSLPAGCWLVVFRMAGMARFRQSQCGMAQHQQHQQHRHNTHHTTRRSATPGWLVCPLTCLVPGCLPVCLSACLSACLPACDSQQIKIIAKKIEKFQAEQVSLEWERMSRRDVFLLSLTISWTTPYHLWLARRAVILLADSARSADRRADLRSFRWNEHA